MRAEIIKFKKRATKVTVASNTKGKRQNLNDYFLGVDVDKFVHIVEQTQDAFFFGKIKLASEVVDFQESFDHVKFIEFDGEEKVDKLIFSDINTQNTITISVKQIDKISSIVNSEDSYWCDIGIVMTDSTRIVLTLYYCEMLEKKDCARTTLLRS